MQHFNQYGIAALMLFLGTALPVVAQDEAQGEVTEVTEVAAKIKKAKQGKQYPTIEVKGKVVDAITGEPLAGAQIKAFHNSYYTAMADENGEYTILVPKFVTALSVQLEGYNLNNVSINGRTTNVDARLHPDVLQADYSTSATARKSIVAGDFVNTPALTIDQEIQNRLGADVRSIQRSANPGQGVAMFINGLNSLYSNAMPLILLDGVVFDQMYDATMLHTGYFNNLLEGINVDDIESVEVLKNGTAIYGAKAANGVISIKTKRCHSMATRIDVNINAGVESRPKSFELMDAGLYRSYVSDLLKTSNSRLMDFKFLGTDPDNVDDYYYNEYHNNTDWKKEVYRTAVTQNYGISIQGGDDIAQYNLSVGYSKAESTLRKNDQQRFNVRFNTDIVLNRWFYTRFDASYANVTRNLRSDGWEDNQELQALAAPSALANIKAPFLTPYDFSTDRRQSSFIADADTYLDEIVGTKGQIANPVAVLYNADAKNKNHSDCTLMNVTIAPTWNPIKDFSLTEVFSYSSQSFDETYYTPRTGMPSFLKEGNVNTTHNSKNSVFSRHNALFSDTRADWTVLGNGAHRLEVLGGIRFMNDTYNASYVYADNSPDDKRPNGASQNRKIDGSDTNWRSLSYYANVDYNYKERYYLTGQLSMETSSRYGKNAGNAKMFGVAWGFFPSIQASWVITNEDWFRPNRVVNMLKLSTGFESVGNDAIDNSATLTYMSSELMFGNTTSTLGLGNIGSSSLQWETTNRCNIGLEGNFFDNRLNLRANYFYSKTDNLIALGTLAYVAGLTDYYTNDGALKNHGFDIVMNAKLINNRNFKMELGASMGHYKNKLTRLPQGVSSMPLLEAYGANILSQVGSPVGLFYGYKTNGVYADSEAASRDGLFIRDDADNEVPFQAGDMRFVDKDGNGEINEKDRFVIGDPNPDIYGNINLRFHIGQNWSVAANFNYSLGNDIYNYQRYVLESGSQFINQTTAVTRRWTYEGQQTDIPRSVYQDPMGNSRFSDRWIEDGSYLKLKNITLSYKVPVRNEYIQGLTVWAAANNLLTLTKYLGPDPEVSCGNSVLYQGIDAGYLSSGRSFHIGVKINL